MNRENKFRGKRLDDGEWLYGSLVGIYDTAFIINRDDIDWNPNTDIYAFWFDNQDCLVDSATVGQYTGLKDKNGMDIYEWDIVRSPRYKDPVVVCFIEGCFAVCDPNCCETCGRFATGIENLADAIILSNRELEVIGNIHDNPELLKTKTI